MVIISDLDGTGGIDGTIGTDGIAGTVGIDGTILDMLAGVVSVTGLGGIMEHGVVAQVYTGITSTTLEIST